MQKTELAASHLDQVSGNPLADNATKYVFRQRVFETLDHDQLYQ
jgi:hypothetical protein